MALTIETHLDDLRRILLSASADPETRRSLASFLRAAVTVLEGPDTPPKSLDMSVMAHAAREIADMLGLAADHASFLADQAAGFMGTRSPP